MSANQNPNVSPEGFALCTERNSSTWRIVPHVEFWHPEWGGALRGIDLRDRSTLLPGHVWFRLVMPN